MGHLGSWKFQVYIIFNRDLIAYNQDYLILLHFNPTFNTVHQVEQIGSR